MYFALGGPWGRKKSFFFKKKLFFPKFFFQSFKTGKLSIKSRKHLLKSIFLRYETSYLHESVHYSVRPSLVRKTDKKPLSLCFFFLKVDFRPHFARSYRIIDQSTQHSTFVFCFWKLHRLFPRLYRKNLEYLAQKNFYCPLFRQKYALKKGFLGCILPWEGPEAEKQTFFSKNFFFKVLK